MPPPGALLCRGSHPQHPDVVPALIPDLGRIVSRTGRIVTTLIGMALDLETEGGSLEHHHHQVQWIIVIRVYTAFHPLVSRRDHHPEPVALRARDNPHLLYHNHYKFHAPPYRPHLLILSPHYPPYPHLRLAAQVIPSPVTALRNRHCAKLRRNLTPFPMIPIGAFHREHLLASRSPTSFSSFQHIGILELILE